MAPQPPTPPEDPPAELDLGGWRVQPLQNRLGRAGRVVRLEPKVMDVLLHLVSRAGQVVSKDQLADAVWPDLFVSESVVTRAIAELRRAVGDDVRNPHFIETIAKRGYRLLVSPAPAAREGAPSAAGGSFPFVAGQWVRGERFFGRDEEIRTILEGPRNGLWVLGTRAIGKTSLLKELEHRTVNDPASSYFPLFWDLQGSVEPGRLVEDFEAVLADAEDRLEALGLARRDLPGDDLWALLGGLRRALRSRGRTLLLLWDEVEELLPLDAADPTLLRKFRRTLQSQEGIRTVMASGPRLWELADPRGDTSPFLHGFAPPLPLGPLDDAAARTLVRQAGSALADHEDALSALLRRSGRHPSLLPLLCARTLELGDLELATDAVLREPTIERFFRVDFGLLSGREQQVLLALASGQAVPSEDPTTRAARAQLQQLGLLRPGPAGGLEVQNPLFLRWLQEAPGAGR